VNNGIKFLFLIDPPIKHENDNILLAVNKIWYIFFDYLINQKQFKTIFFHNLDCLDGYFIYKALLNYITLTHIYSIIDHHNDWINFKF